MNLLTQNMPRLQIFFYNLIEQNWCYNLSKTLGMVLLTEKYQGLTVEKCYFINKKDVDVL